MREAVTEISSKMDSVPTPPPPCPLRPSLNYACKSVTCALCSLGLTISQVCMGDGGAPVRAVTCFTAG